MHPSTAWSATEFNEFWGDLDVRSAQQERDFLLPELPLDRTWTWSMLEMVSACPVIQERQPVFLRKGTTTFVCSLRAHNSFFNFPHARIAPESI